MVHSRKVEKLGHLGAIEAARYIKPLWNAKGERVAPIEKLSPLWDVPFVRVTDAEWPYGQETWGKVFYDENDNPTQVVIRYGGDVHPPRSRFTEAHEAGHLAFGDRPTGNGVHRSLNRGRAKELYQKRISTPLRWQDAVGNERADLFAQALLVDEESLQADLRSDRKSFRELCGDYIVSPWVMASSVVRVSPQPCIAIPFSAEGPLGMIHANEAAMKKSGLYEWALTRLWEFRDIGQWSTAEAALKDQSEAIERFEIDGFSVKSVYIPYKPNSWFFRYRNDNATLVALFVEDLETSHAHRLPIAPFTAASGKLHLILGPAGSEKSERLLKELRKQKTERGDERVMAYRFFGLPVDDDNRGSIHPLWDRSGVSILEDLSPEVEVVAFDEAHFAKKRFVHVVKYLLSLGKRVILAASDSDFRAEPWPVIRYLLPIAEALDSRIERPKTACRWPHGCGEAAKYSQLVGHYPDDVYHIITEQDTFYPVCRRHFTASPISPIGWQLSIDNAELPKSVSTRIEQEQLSLRL
jgi:thymidine kinase